MFLKSVPIPGPGLKMTGQYVKCHNISKRNRQCPRQVTVQKLNDTVWCSHETLEGHQSTVLDTVKMHRLQLSGRSPIEKPDRSDFER